MKNTFIKILLALFLLTTITINAFDTLRGAGSSQQIPKEEKTLLDKTKHWYKSLIGKTQDKPTTMQSDDIIIINSDRSITFNGHTLKFGTNVNEWLKVLGDDYRTIGLEKEAYLWDDLGIGFSLKRNNKTGKLFKERFIMSPDKTTD